MTQAIVTILKQHTDDIWTLGLQNIILQISNKQLGHDLCVFAI